MPQPKKSGGIGLRALGFAAVVGILLWVVIAATPPLTTSGGADSPGANRQAPPSNGPELVPVGSSVPNFRVESPDGAPLLLSRFHGQVVVLDFWASWCGPCQQSLPHVESVYKAVKDQNVTVFGVCIFDDRPSFQAWWQQNKDTYTFPIGFDPKGKVREGVGPKLFGITSIPATVVIGRDGKVAGSFQGLIPNGDTRLETVLKKLGVKV